MRTIQRSWLVKLRKEKGMTQKDVACKAGLSRNYYSEIEKGIKTPAGKTAKRLGNTLGFDMSLFF
ncbi:helix-turn-helix domain-containing protein [Marininema halotolerans]|uniref:Helix-turn-helix n=1 Tax=Marininema halotolerans TaxID=1155944 RepID=A0A1I6UQW4_9BACL|nr:helix-turn-helix transcriptional regulator [Marininema halotolerans]SFT03800.1 Helix-turn-helix [Marininema halotolerans]